MASLASKGTFSIAAAITTCSRYRSAHVPPRSFQLLSRVAATSKKVAHPFFAKSITTRSRRDVRAHLSTSARAGQDANAGGIRENDTEQPEDHIKIDESRQLKQFMRTTPYPIAVITASKNRERSGPKAYVGATVSSFNTVSFTPEPVVSFNLLKDSVTLRSIQANRYFVVNLLRNNPRGALLADLFTKGNDPSPFTKAAEDPSNPLKWFTFKRTGTGTIMPPVVQLAKDSEEGDLSTAFAVLCEMKGVVDVGDHAIVLGRALHSHAVPRNEWPQTMTVDKSRKDIENAEVCLSYVHGSYSGSKRRFSDQSVSWLDRDLHRDIPDNMLDEGSLDALAVHYACAAERISDKIEKRQYDGPEEYRSLTLGLNNEQLREALSYYRSRLREANTRRASLRVTKLTDPDTVITVEPSLVRGEQVELRTKVAMRPIELMEERRIYQEKLTQLEQIQAFQGNELKHQRTASADTKTAEADIELQIRNYKRALQVIQAALLHKLRSRALGDTILDLIPLSRSERAEFDQSLGMSILSLRKQVESSRNDFLVDRRDDGKGSTQRDRLLTLQAARKSRILWSAIVLKLMSATPKDKDAQRYLEARIAPQALPGFRKVFADESEADTKRDEPAHAQP